MTSNLVPNSTCVMERNRNFMFVLKADYNICVYLPAKSKTHQECHDKIIHTHVFVRTYKNTYIICILYLLSCCIYRNIFTWRYFQQTLHRLSQITC